MDAKIEIFTKNMELTERINTYVTKKVSKLDKFLNGLDEIRVDLSYVKSAKNSADRQVAQLTLRGKRFILRAEERSDDIFTAIDLAMEKLQRQVERFKGKKLLRNGRGDRTEISQVLAQEEAVEEEEFQPVIARRKQFNLVPMDELEAIEQMTLLGHENFFVFYNGNTNKINVIYRRRDGTYGLIDPVLG